MLIQIIFLFLASDIGYSLQLPSYIKPCDRKDAKFDDCSLEHAKAALPSILKGDKKYGIPKFNPLKLETVTLQNADHLSLKFKNVEIYGVKNIILQKFKIDLNEKKVLVKADIPNLSLLGDYEMKGRILVLPLNGNGKANVTCAGVKFSYTFNYDLVTKEGEEYAVVAKDNLEFKIGKAFFQFSNLFNGNKAIGESTNEVLNEEWEKVVEELRPAIKETIITIAKTIINGITNKIPFNEFVQSA